MVDLRLESLPLELLVDSICCLDLKDYSNLRRTSKFFRDLLHDEGLLEKSARRNIRFSKEVAQVEKGLTTCPFAVDRATSRMRSIVLGKPYSIVTLGYGSSFVYNDGILCYLSAEHHVRVLDVFGSSTVEKVINLRTVRQHLEDHRIAHDFHLLRYANGLLTMRLDHEEGAEQVISMAIMGSSPSDEILTTIIPGSSGSLVVRNDHEHIVAMDRMQRMDPHTGQSRREWRIRYISRTHNAATNDAHWSPAIYLHNFFGSDVSQTVAFEIFDGSVYAVSNQSTFEVEEVDYTSYYHCWRIKLDASNKPSLQHRRLWRRQHREGVINDRWTDINITKDEKTGAVMIVEARREWLGERSSKEIRTVYFTALDFDTEEDNDKVTLDVGTNVLIATPNYRIATSGSSAAAFPANDPLARILTKDDQPNFEEPPIRPRSSYHRLPVSSNSSALLFSNHKHRAYLPGASTALDLLMIPRRGNDIHQPTLRTSSRCLLSPIEKATGLLRRTILDPRNKNPVQDSELAYDERKTVGWPPDDAPELLKEVLSPHGATNMRSKVEAASDERSLVFVGQGSFESLGQAITLMNFDKYVNLGGPRLSSQDGKALEALRTSMEKWRSHIRTGTYRPQISDERFVEVNGQQRRWMWTEPSWLSSGCGAEYIV